MGAWGASPFENDEAADWVIELSSANDWDVIIDAIVPIHDLEDGDSEIESIALAASAVIAAALSEEIVLDEYAEPASEFLERVDPPTQKIIALGLDTIDFLNEEKSELEELWEEDEEWIASINLIGKILKDNFTDYKHLELQS